MLIAFICVLGLISCSDKLDPQPTVKVYYGGKTYLAAVIPTAPKDYLNEVPGPPGYTCWLIAGAVVCRKN